MFRRCSGEWRNGRRAGFRCQCPSGRGGSSPPSTTTRRGHELIRVRSLVFCCRLSGRSLNEAQNEVQCGARKRVADWLRGRGGRSDLRGHHPWRQCAGWEIDDGVDVVDGVVGTVGHRERETAEVGDRSVGRCSTNCTAEGDRGSERADTEGCGGSGQTSRRCGSIHRCAPFRGDSIRARDAKQPGDCNYCRGR